MNETAPVSTENQAKSSSRMIEVPDWVLIDAQADMAGKAIESATGIENPGRQDVVDLKIQVSRIPTVPRSAFPDYQPQQNPAPMESTQHDAIDDMKIPKITVIEAQPKDPPKKKRFWQ